MSFGISKILVPVDFSRRAEVAARYAQRLAANFKAELILLHVIEPLHVDYAMVDPFEDSLREISRVKRSNKQRELDEFALPTSTGVKVTRNIAEGDPAAEILSCSKSAGVDLLVMPTQGHGRLRGLLIGSVTAKVLDQSERPVLTGVHLENVDPRAQWTVRHLLCAVDLGSRSQAVLQWGAALAEQFQAKISVLHVASGVLSDDNVENRLSAAMKSAGLEGSGSVASGDPHKVIAATAAQQRADLVVIGRGVTTDTMGRLRAQAYGIIRQTPCPVLSV